MSKLTETERAHMTMDMLRMARSGKYHRAEPLINDVKQMFPSATEEEVKDALLVVLRMKEQA